jgi:hypothetical protein
MSKKKWREIEAALDKLAREAAEGVGQLRGKSGKRALPLEQDEGTSKAGKAEGMGEKSPQEQSREIINRLARKGDPNHRPDPVLSRLMGRSPLREPPPDDMPALEKIKLYARSATTCTTSARTRTSSGCGRRRSRTLKSSTRKKLPVGISTSNRAIIVPRDKGVYTGIH